MTIDAVFSPRLTGVTAVILLFPVLLIDRLLRARWIADRRWLRMVATLTIGAVLAGSTWWNLQTTFVRYPRKSRVGYRDHIVRLASDLGNVKTIANFSGAETFDHQAYRAIIPDIVGQNLSPGEESLSNPIAVIEELRPGVLVIVSLWDEELYGLCDQVGGDPAGIVVMGEGRSGFEWCFVE